jgi:hypothetical protein
MWMTAFLPEGEVVMTYLQSAQAKEIHKILATPDAPVAIV